MYIELMEKKDNYGGQYAVQIISGGSGNEGIKITLKKLKPSMTYYVSVRAKVSTGSYYTAKIWTSGAYTNMSVYTAETSWDPIDRDISNRFFWY